MTNTRVGDEITIKMTQKEYLRLFSVLGAATGVARRYGREDVINEIVGFLQELTSTNPYMW